MNSRITAIGHQRISSGRVEIQTPVILAKLPHLRIKQINDLYFLRICIELTMDELIASNSFI
jgi:hypothetical protein